jgi:hypothetical protein
MKLWRKQKVFVRVGNSTFKSNEEFDKFYLEKAYELENNRKYGKEYVS